MDDSSIIFSICIPTFNEAKYLEKVLNSIITQEEFINKNVEIIVSDNNSDDGTDKLLSKYTYKYSNIIYIKNSENIGSTENTILAVSKAHGELIKISTSSTMYNEGSLKIIIDYIKKYKSSCVQLYFSNGDYGVNQILSFKNFAEITSVKNTNYLTWSLWKNDVDDYLFDHKFDWTNIPACYFNLKYVYKYDKALVINNKLFTQQKRYPKYLLYGVFNVFCKNIYEIHKYFIKLGALDVAFLNRLKKKIGYWLIYWVIVFEFNDNDYKFAKFENLKYEFINSYKHENYFLNLYCRYMLNKIKYFFKRKGRKH